MLPVPGANAGAGAMLSSTPTGSPDPSSRTTAAAGSCYAGPVVTGTGNIRPCCTPPLSARISSVGPAAPQPWPTPGPTNRSS